LNGVADGDGGGLAEAGHSQQQREMEELPHLFRHYLFMEGQRSPVKHVTLI
jgi:hypothetical protein